jgi:hypothetical protein
MYNLDDIESQVTDNETRQALLSVLKARLARLQDQQPESGLTKIPTKNSADSGESGESALQPQPLPPESEVSPGESDSPPTEPGERDDPPENARKFAAALDKLDPALRAAAADLYELLHYKSKFARLTSTQREAIVELLRHHTCEDVAKIIAEPPPIGMSLQTSKPGVIRFRDDYMRCAMQHGKRESEQAAEQRRLAFDESFKAANASDDSFRNVTQSEIRKRLFRAAHDPASDYHEIRWLIKSLEMLRT